MGVKFNINKPNSPLKAEYREKTLGHNSKKLVVLMGFIVLSQILLSAIELLGLKELLYENIYARAVTIFFLIIFISLLTSIRKASEKAKETRWLAFAKVTIQILIISVGIYLSAFMYSKEIYSFNTVIIAMLIVSFTNIYWPYTFNVLMLSGFLGLVFFIKMSYEVPPYYWDEVQTVLLLLILIGVGNILIHKRNWELFVKEKKINIMNKKLVEISHVDELTGVYNRRKVSDELDSIISSAQEGDTDFCVVMIDIDNFKRVNDKYGHAVGDEALRQFTAKVKENLRKDDIFGRWGGEEFIVVIPNSTKEDAFKFIERVRVAVQNYEFDTVGTITFSAGICSYQPEYTNYKVVDNADFALYISKQLGRNKVSVFAST